MFDSQNIQVTKSSTFELQLISKRNPTQNNENEKYVIRYSKDDNEEAEIIEVNRQNIEHDGDEIVELNDGMEASTTFRRRNGKL